MPQPKSPKVTLAIPAYNCAATIAATIDSCLAQTCPSVEVLVVDDGSTDATAVVLAGYGDRIRVIRQPNGGLASARNTAMQAASGDFIAWMDADDLCLPDRLLAQAAVLEKFSEVVLVSSNFNAFSQPDVDDAVLYLTSYYSAVQRLGGLEVIYPREDDLEVAGSTSSHRFRVRRGQVGDALLNGNFVHPPTVMFRRSAWQTLGDCDISFKYISDYEFFMRVSHLGEFAVLEAPLLRYRISNSQMTKSAVNGPMQLELIALMDRLRRASPEVYERHKALFEQRYARSYLSAAAAIGNTRRARSLLLLWHGLKHNASLKESVVILARILLPQPVQSTLRRLRRASART